MFSQTEWALTVYTDGTRQGKTWSAQGSGLTDAKTVGILFYSTSSLFRFFRRGGTQLDPSGGVYLITRVSRDDYTDFSRVDSVIR